MFTAPLALSLLVDTPLLLWAARRPRAKMVALGLFGMGLSLVLAGLARGVVEFGIAFALFAPASGLACSLAQAALMDGDPDGRERNMANWALAGTLGDLFAPICIAAAVWFSGTHRAAYLGVGALLMLLAVPLARRPLATGNEPPEDESVGASLGAAFSNRTLLLWLAGVALCGLLDEIFATFGALWLRQHFPEDPDVVVKALSAQTLGGLLGLVVLKRLLGRYSPRVLLATACAGSIIAAVLFLGARSAWSATLFVALVGLFVSFHYPLAQAQAYRAAEGRSDLVAALGPAVTSFELLSPFVLGLIADRYGLTLALAALVAQPAGLLLILATRAGRRRPESSRAR